MEKVFFSIADRVVIDEVALENGEPVSACYREPIEVIRQRYPDVQIGTYEEAYQQIEKARITEPSEITEEAFDRALDALPPLGWYTSKEEESFKFAEFIFGSLTTIYARVGKRCFSFINSGKLTHREIMQIVKKHIDSQ